MTTENVKFPSFSLQALKPFLILPSEWILCSSTSLHSCHVLPMPPRCVDDRITVKHDKCVFPAARVKIKKCFTLRNICCRLPAKSLHLWISQAFTGFLDLPWIHKYADCKNSSVPLWKSGWVVNTWNYQRWPMYAFEWTKKQKNIIARIFWPLWLGFQSQSFQLWMGWIIQGDKSDAAPATWGRLVFYVAVEPGCMHYAQR